MNNLPKCELCGVQIENAPAIGWFCPTKNCEGKWDEKIQLVFKRLRTNEALEEQIANQNEWIKRIKAVKDFDLDGWLDWDTEIQIYNKRITELEKALLEAADDLDRANCTLSHNKYRIVVQSKEFKK